MKNLNILNELKIRGFISQISNINDFERFLLFNQISLYCGFDPTSDSLHVGHILPLICLAWFKKYNHKAIVLIGGATALIGDPSFKNQERLLHDSNFTSFCSKKIIDQILLFFKNINLSPPIIVNNYDWFKKINLISFLRDIGKFFLVNQMISKTFVKDRINRSDQGISFTEFSYNLLQSYDFLELYKTYKVHLQIGGSDQWGNILSGIDLIRKLYHDQTFGLTVPLLTQPNGVKFGKTEKDKIIWLNRDKTSPYAFYQFWLNIQDESIIDFLKLFTFLEISEIQKIKYDFDILSKDYFYFKSILADHITRIIHGQHELDAAKRITNSLFFGNINHLKESDFDQLRQDGIPSIDLNGSEDLRQALVLSGLSSSRNDAYKLINSNAISVNNKKEKNPNYLFHATDKLFGKFTILLKGKKKYSLLCWRGY
ncbi:tyrosine--tRNA ligase [Buchnera aphidicola]|uniref:tyrosine--tRNA ligase n=1 Tax=Buchnera aphidicola TaxID=9 RepID=UPI00346475ED